MTDLFRVPAAGYAFVLTDDHGWTRDVPAPGLWPAQFADVLAACEWDQELRRQACLATYEQALTVAEGAAVPAALARDLFDVSAGNLTDSSGAAELLGWRNAQRVNRELWGGNFPHPAFRRGRAGKPGRNMWTVDQIVRFKAVLPGRGAARTHDVYGTPLAALEAP